MRRVFLSSAAFAAAGLLAACSAEKPDAAADAAPAADLAAETAPSLTPEPTSEPAPAGSLMATLDGSPVATSPEVVAADLSARIAVLSDDYYEGRAPATERGEESADWIAGEMERLGLEPAGENGTFFQRVPLVESTLDEANSSFVITDGEEEVQGVVRDDFVYWTKRVEDEVSFEDAPLVFVGYGAVAPEYGWNDYEGLDAAGKTVVMLVNDPGYADPDSGLFNGRAMTYYGRWTYKYEEAARQGATAAIIIHETAPASYPWAVVEGSWSGAQLEQVFEDKGASRAALEGWITVDKAKELFGRAGLDFQAMKQAALSPDFAPTPMGDLKLSSTIRSDHKTLDSRNVLGRVPGTERPDEHVLFMAHWDHLGKQDLGEGVDGIFNGAVDNATGTSAILEIAEAFAAEPAERSAVFLAVTAEESGLLGSAYYANNPIVPLERTVAGMNIDGMLPGPRAHDIMVVGYGASELEDILAEEAEPFGIRITPDAQPEAGYFYRSDHISLAKKGVPVLYADGGQDLREGGFAAGKMIADAYRELAYHRPGDEFDPATWDMSGIEEVIVVFERVGRRIANSSDWPNWYEGNEFRALRDAQMAKSAPQEAEAGEANDTGEAVGEDDTQSSEN